MKKSLLIIVRCFAVGCVARIENGEFTGFAPYTKSEQAERERKERDEEWERFRLKYDLAAYDEKHKGTDKERQAFDDSDWDKFEAELRDRPR